MYQKILRGFAYFYGTGMYIGFLPLRGLWGAIMGAALGWLARGLFWPIQLGIIILATLLAMPIGSFIEAAAGKKDPKIVIIDEVIGAFIATVFFTDLISVALGFFLFLLFDRLKPFPAYALQSLYGGAGILIDDVVAGAYAFLIVTIFALFHVIG